MSILLGLKLCDGDEGMDFAAIVFLSVRQVPFIQKQALVEVGTCFWMSTLLKLLLRSGVPLWEQCGYDLRY